MRLLVLGGTRFLGRAVVETALTSGWEVTTLTRGESGAPPSAVDARTGDRTTPDGLAALGRGEWDVVVDTSGFVPRDVLASANALNGRVGHYVFVSTVNVHPGWPEEQIRPGSPLHECASDAGPDDGDYGVLKAGCERAVEEVFGPASTVVRSGLLVGPYDNTERLSWWLSRISKGGEVLAGGSPEQPTQLIDVRDLSAWMLHCGQAGVGGGFAATALPGSSTFGRMLDAAVRATGSGATLTWADHQFLLDHDVTPWTELPLWMVPEKAPHTWDVDTAQAQAAGLTCRAIEEAVVDTWAWIRGGGAPTVRNERTGTRIEPAKEREILAAWHAR